MKMDYIGKKSMAEQTAKVNREAKPAIAAIQSGPGKNGVITRNKKGL